MCTCVSVSPQEAKGLRRFPELKRHEQTPSNLPASCPCLSAVIHFEVFPRRLSSQGAPSLPRVTPCFSPTPHRSRLDVSSTNRMTTPPVHILPEAAIPSPGPATVRTSPRTARYSYQAVLPTARPALIRSLLPCHACILHRRLTPADPAP